MMVVNGYNMVFKDESVAMLVFSILSSLLNPHFGKSSKLLVGT